MLTYLKDQLYDKGAWDVDLTRTSDIAVSLKDRAQFAVDNWANRFISIHHNASTNSNTNGTEVYIYNGMRTDYVSKDMAKKVQSELVSELGLSNRGVKKANLAVLRYLYQKSTPFAIPGILTEASFISNPQEEKKLRQKSYRKREASAIVRGIIKHAKEYDRWDTDW